MYTCVAYIQTLIYGTGDVFCLNGGDDQVNFTTYVFVYKHMYSICYTCIGIDIHMVPELCPLSIVVMIYMIYIYMIAYMLYMYTHVCTVYMYVYVCMYVCM